jgi:hypothetical protein
VDDTPVDVSLNPYAAFPGAPAAPRDVRPLNARITHRAPSDPQLFAFLDRLTAAVEAGNWGAVALFAEEDGLREQMLFLVDNGQSPRRAAADVLSLALGLDMASNPLLPAGADRDTAPFAGLDRVSNITVQSIVADPPAGVARATGYVRLDDRTTPEFSLAIIATPRGPRLVVPRG